MMKKRLSCLVTNTYSGEYTNILPGCQVLEFPSVAISPAIPTSAKQDVFIFPLLSVVIPAAAQNRQETKGLLTLVGLDGEALEIAGELSYGKQKQLELKFLREERNQFKKRKKPNYRQKKQSTYKKQPPKSK